MAQITQRSFTAGELAPALRVRADLAKFGNGLALCKNFIPRAQGGAYSRPGTRFVGEIGDSSKRGRLIPFQFNTQQTYQLVFEHNTMRVVKDGGFVLKALATVTNVTQANPAVVSAVNDFTNGETVTINNVVGMTELNGNSYTVANATGTSFELQGTDSTGFTAYTSGGDAQSDGIFELTTTYTEDEVPDLVFTQSADVMTITHPSHDPANLSRTGHAAWTLADIDFTPTIAAPTGIASSAVGTGAGSYNKKYEYVVTAVDANGVESLASGSTEITTNSLSQTAGVRVTWNTVTGAVLYRVYKDPSEDTDTYGWIGDSKVAEFTDYNIAPDTSLAPLEDRTPFDGAGNKPAAVNYYQQRLVFANTGNDPQTMFATQTAQYDSLRTATPSRPTDAVTMTIAARQVNEIRHIIALDALILLTSGAEWKVTEGSDDVLEPATVGAKIQSYNGASKVSPAIINGTVVYVQEKGAKLRDLQYNFADDKYSGNDISILAQHLFEGYQIEEMAYAAEPYGVLWCVRSDGVLLGLTYQREHEVQAWHQHDTQGSYESVSTITEGDRDATYVIVKRTVNGATKRYVERIEPREEADSRDCFYVDCGLSLDVPLAPTSVTKADPAVVTLNSHGGSDGDFFDFDDAVGMTELSGRYKIANSTANTFELTDQYTGDNIDSTAWGTFVSATARRAVAALSGLDHLEGMSVVALADGNVVEDLTIASGAVTLPTPASRVHIGLSYTPTLRTIGIDSTQATYRGNVKGIAAVTLTMFQSRGGWVGPVLDSGADSTMLRELLPRAEADNYDAPQLKTWDQEITIEAGWTQNGEIMIEQRDPLPLAILGITPEAIVGG